MPSGGTEPAEVDELVEHVADRIAAGAHKHALLRELREKFGKVSVDNYERLRRRAEALIRSRCENKGTELSNAISFYKSIIEDENINVKERLRARQQLDKILGIEFISGSVGDQAESVRKAVEKIDGT